MRLTALRAKRRHKKKKRESEMKNLHENAAIAMPDLVLAAATTFTTDTNVIDLTQYAECLCILQLNQSGAGTGTVTLKQSSVADGSDEKALAFTEYWNNETGVTTSVLTRVEAAALTTAGANTGANTYVFRVRAEMLDSDNDFRFVRLDLASLSNNTAAALIYIPYAPYVARGADDMPEAIA
jgi:hypothetical protein